MTIQLVNEYLVALIGLVVGAGAGLIAGAVYGRATPRGVPLGRWDTRVTIPLLLAAAGAHLVLIPLVESRRQVLFGLYFAALIGAVIFAMAGLSIWRLGAVLLPVGSVLAYFYFALQVHEADYVGLAVKVVELAAVAAAGLPIARRRRDFTRKQAVEEKELLTSG